MVHILSGPIPIGPYRLLHIPQLLLLSLQKVTYRSRRTSFSPFRRLDVFWRLATGYAEGAAHATIQFR